RVPHSTRSVGWGFCFSSARSRVRVLLFVAVILSEAARSVGWGFCFSCCHPERSDAPASRSRRTPFPARLCPARRAFFLSPGTQSLGISPRIPGPGGHRSFKWNDASLLRDFAFLC